jgi:hypothetical protein
MSEPRSEHTAACDIDKFEPYHESGCFQFRRWRQFLKNMYKILLGNIKLLLENNNCKSHVPYLKMYLFKALKCQLKLNIVGSVILSQYSYQETEGTSSKFKFCNIIVVMTAQTHNINLWYINKNRFKKWFTFTNTFVLVIFLLLCFFFNMPMRFI